MLHTDIGEKIKRLRLQRNMTQSDLAGDQITRNMLSRVENGAALPSLPTVWYLAERLGVPAGFLLAEGDDDRLWRKMNRIDDIRRVLRSGNARICLELCREDAEVGQADDEIYLIMAQCALSLAREEFDAGHLHEVCTLLDHALEYARHTLYETSAIRQTVALYFRFMNRLSSMLYSEMLPQEIDALLGSEDALCRHLAAHAQMSRGDYVQAGELLTQLLHDESARSEVLMYCLFCDLEICCREQSDFRGAYEYSQNKVALLEKMLR